jgi:hypothetical protein
MSRHRRVANQIGTAGFGPIDTPTTDTSFEDLDPDKTTGRVRGQEEDLEKGRTRSKRKMRRSGTTTDRK